jgi:hypothetical protein
MHERATRGWGVVSIGGNMQFRTISFVLATLALGACASASDPIGESTDLAKGGRSAEHKKDGGCKPSAPGEGSPCANGGGSGGQGKSDAGHLGVGDDEEDDQTIDPSMN